MTFLDSNEARGGLKSRNFLHHAKFICTAVRYLLLYLHLHWRLGALTLISWKQPLTQRSTGPCLQHHTSGTIACCTSATIVHSSASVLYIVCPHIFVYVSSHFSYPYFLLLLLLLHTCVTITLVLYYNLQNVTVVTTELYPFVENCSQALPRAQSFWWEIRVAACYWMVQYWYWMLLDVTKYAWCY